MGIGYLVVGRIYLPRPVRIPMRIQPEFIELIIRGLDAFPLRHDEMPEATVRVECFATGGPHVHVFDLAARIIGHDIVVQAPWIAGGAETAPFAAAIRIIVITFDQIRGRPIREAGHAPLFIVAKGIGVAQ